jgi:pectinesterase
MTSTTFFRFRKLFLGISIATMSSTTWAACSYTVTNNWGSGFTGEIKVTNNTSQSVNGWSVSWQESGASITNAWNATLSGSNPYTAASVGWNGTLAPGASATFGFQANGTASAPTVSGSLCSGTSVSSSISSSRSSSISSSSRSSSISSLSRSSSISSSRSSSSISNSQSSSSISSSSTANESTWVFEENAVGFCSTAGVIDNKHTGYTGTGFYDSENAVGATLNWSVSAASAKTYSARIRFGNGSTAARRATLVVNDTQVTSLDFPSNSSWTQWQTVNVNLPLKAGTNSVKLVAETANGLANIDSISVTGNGITPASCPQVSSDCPLTQEGFSTVNADGQNGTTGGHCH